MYSLFGGEFEVPPLPEPPADQNPNPNPNPNPNRSASTPSTSRSSYLLIPESEGVDRKLLDFS
jgi:hypothetical protein